MDYKDRHCYALCFDHLCDRHKMFGQNSAAVEKLALKNF